MTHAAHPKEMEACIECGARSFSKKRRIKQVGMTYECDECGTELAVYDNSDYGMGESLTWQPVEPIIQALGHERECLNCGYVWHYTGSSERPTCPSCRGKNTEAKTNE